MLEFKCSLINGWYLFDLKLRFDVDNIIKLVYVEYSLILSYMLCNIRFIN